MKLSTRFVMALALLFAPLVASAQFKDLDQALSSLSRGFGHGDARAIVAGIAENEQVVLRFPDLVTETGPFGRDQAQYLLDGLFKRVKPTGFEEVNSRKDGKEGQQHIVGRWTIMAAGKPQARDLYITLRINGDHYSLLSVTSGSK